MELFRALAVLAEPPTLKTAPVAAALELGPLPSAEEYTETFVFQLYPYASVYLGSEGMIGGEARDRVAGFWRALGQMPPAEPDHLSLMLALYARLVELEDDEGEEKRRAVWRNARRAFLWEHLLSWLHVYLHKLIGTATGFYALWAALLLRALASEAATVGEQGQLPLHLRETQGLIDPRSSGIEEFCQSVLTPVRFGGILTRADLQRAGRQLDLRLRVGERKFILKTLLAQDAHGVFDWLIEEATLWTREHRTAKEFGDIASAWEKRTENSAALLQELKLAARDVI